MFRGGRWYRAYSHLQKSHHSAILCLNACFAPNKLMPAILNWHAKSFLNVNHKIWRINYWINLKTRWISHCFNKYIIYRIISDFCNVMIFLPFFLRWKFENSVQNSNFDHVYLKWSFTFIKKWKVSFYYIVSK